MDRCENFYFVQCGMDHMSGPPKGIKIRMSYHTFQKGHFGTVKNRSSAVAFEGQTKIVRYICDCFLLTLSMLMHHSEKERFKKRSHFLFRISSFSFSFLQKHGAFTPGLSDFSGLGSHCSDQFNGIVQMIGSNFLQKDLILIGTKC